MVVPKSQVKFISNNQMETLTETIFFYTTAGYCVEKRSSTSTSWTKVITLDAHQLHYTIDNLKDKCEYWFRVSAENEVGLGAPAVTESISLKTHASKLSLARQVNAALIRFHS